LLNAGRDTATPAGKAMFQMMGFFAEFERSMIRERVKAGIVRARAQGKALGRPTIDAKTEAAIRKDLQKGEAGISWRLTERRPRPRGCAFFKTLSANVITPLL
jgi:DNA invertase Pin-like site-specific DNA recombinase